MLQFKISDTTASLILTLSELTTVTDPYYLIIFTHVLTKDEVAVLLNSADDTSSYPSRYNEFSINPSTVFAGKKRGEWHYKIYEQASSTNTDPGNSGDVVEEGKLMLDPTTDFSFTQYEEETSYMTYDG